MKKLIAQRPVQYQGRAYGRGDSLPTADPLMTAAWLKAGSAAWESPPAENAPAGPAPDSGAALRRETERQAAEALASYGVAIADGAGNFIGKEALAKQLISIPTAETQAAGTLRALGVEFMDEEGRFVGEERLKEQLCGLVQELLPDYEDVVPEAGSLEDGALPEEGGRALDTEPDGHYSRAGLSRLTKAELLDLAEDLGVDLSGCRTNAERAEALAAVDAAAILKAGERDFPPGAPV